MLIAETLSNNASTIVDSGKPTKVTYNKPNGTLYFETSDKRVFLGYSLDAVEIANTKLKSFLSCTICNKDFTNPQFFYCQDFDSDELKEKCGIWIQKANGTVKFNIDPLGASSHLINASFVPTWGINLGDNLIPSHSKNIKTFNNSDLVLVVAMEDATFATAQLLPNILSAEETGHLLSHTYFNKEGEYGFFVPEFTNNKNTKLKHPNFMVVVYPGYKDYFASKE
jgi:hypothetical protein